MKFKALKASIFLSVLFLVVYGGCNYLTSLRHDVGAFYFAWERYIPFIPLFIVPYMSIDLFFVAAPFLCANERELRTFSRRIVMAILVAGACFLLFPLHFAFERPHVEGILGVVFNHFRNMDQPFNEFPSLHIALRTILAVLYARKTRGLLNYAVRIWFSLIGFSTLFTYQHHVIDVIGGFALASLCIHLIQDEPLAQPTLSNPRVGLYFLGGSAILFLISFTFRPASLLFIWPAISMALISSAYFGVGPGIFRKRDGELPLLTHLLFWPVLLGQYLSWKHYARQGDAWNAIHPNLWIGRRLAGAEARHAVEQGVTAVLDLAGESTESPAFLSIAYRQLSIMDLTAPTLDQLDNGVEFIRARASGGIVYIHCKAGYSRTAAFAGAYLMAAGHAPNAEAAVQMLRSARPHIIIRPEIINALHDYQSRLISTALPTP